MPRPSRRGPLVPTPPTTATVKHTQAPPTIGNPAGQRSIRLTVKAPPSKLREVFTGRDLEAAASQRRTLSRSSKNKKPIVDPSSDEEDGDAESAEEDVEMADADNAGDDEEEDRARMGEEDEDGDEEEDDDEDEDEDEPGATISVRGLPPKPPVLRVTAPARALSPGRVLKIPPKVESVESKEMRTGKMRGGRGGRAGSDDEELSDVGSDENDEEEEQESDEEMDGEGDDNEDLDGEGEDEDPADDDSDAVSESSGADSDLPPLSAIQAAAQNLPGQGTSAAPDSAAPSDSDPLSPSPSDDDDPSTSRAETPDPNKLTRRQRRTSPTSLLALSNEAQKKKHFTAEQITMRRAEMARRRKDLSEKRAQEEKADTLKRLLEKPTGPKRRSRAQVLADLEREEFGLERPGVAYGGAGTPGEEGEVEVERVYVKAKAAWCRTVVRAEGSRVAVPEEWLGGPVGRVFEVGTGGEGEQGRREWKVVSGSRMVQVVE